MLTFEDLLAAKVAIQMERLTADGAKAGLQAALAGGRTLVQELERSGALDQATARVVAGHARRCSFLKAESVYVSFLRQRQIADEPTIDRARVRQRQENLRIRLGDILVQEGVLTREADQGILAEARTAFVADNAQVTDRYVAKGFEGIERSSSTVAEVLGQLAPGENTGSSPYDSKFPGGPGAAIPPGGTPPAVPPRPAAVPPRANRPMPVAVSSDGAVDLRNLGHSGEIVPTAGRHGAAVAQLGLPAAAPVPVAPAPAPPLVPAGPSPLAGTGLESRYQVRKKLGEGGMGAVYLVHEAQSDRDVALKLVLDREKSQEAAGRFKREILATSMCGHENVIEIYDAGDTKDGSYFMAMEYVPGEELADIIKREGAVALPRAVDFFEQILTGIGAVHSAGIVHRDLKPQNFRIYRDPQTNQERVKIMDFGIARISDDQQFGDQLYKTMGGKITGSPAYLAPESITEPEVDQRADLYSLGIAFFRMTTGKLPFTAKEPMEYLPKHLYEKPPVPSQVAPDRGLPPELDALILKLLEKSPDKRYPSAEAVIADLTGKVRPALAGSADVGSSSEKTTAMPAPSSIAAARNKSGRLATTSGSRPVAAPPGVPLTPSAPPATDQETIPADPDALARLASQDVPPNATAPVLAPTGDDADAATLLVAPAGPGAAPTPAKPPQGKRGCLGFLFGR